MKHNRMTAYFDLVLLGYAFASCFTFNCKLETVCGKIFNIVRATICFYITFQTCAGALAAPLILVLFSMQVLKDKCKYRNEIQAVTMLFLCLNTTHKNS